MTGIHGERAPLRDRLLDAAFQLVETKGWQRLRVAHVAAAAGVSRQSAYNEFGSKDALGEALVVREFQRHLDGLKECLMDHRDDATAAVEDAVLYTFRSAEASPLLASILTSARVGWGAEELVEMFRTRSEPLLPYAVRVVADLVGRYRPDLDRPSVELCVDMVIRVTIGYLVTPDGSHEDSAHRIALMADRVLAPV
ncbi:TetR family transcriptional regulator [Actinocorallia longicatena]|uniref:TetR family transcriptional regulator n=1 Tax=Actinocorallia longicatena TaxID=111803 RepID=A0ABP6Q9R2_9ACTN